MTERQPQPIENFIPIPECFYSFETGEKFSSCVDCGTSLLEDGTAYLIQKAFDGEEVVVEFAYCTQCYGRLEEAYSEETINNMWDFFLDSVDFEQRNRFLSLKAPRQLEPWIERCLTCKKSKSELKSYVLIGIFDGPDLLFHHLPYIICEECQLALNDLMSEKSRSEWDKWIGDNLDVPPSVKELIRKGRLVLV